MAGRPKETLYQYDLEDGRFLKKYESHQQVRDIFYPDIKGKLPLFRTHRPYHVLPDDTVLFKTRAGKAKAIWVRKYTRSSYTMDSARHRRPFAIYNMDGEEIARFGSPYIWAKMTGKKSCRIIKKLNNQEGYYDKEGLMYKYLEEKGEL